MVTVRVCSKLKISSKSVVFTNIVGKSSQYFVEVLNKTIIPLALLGYEMIIASASSAIYHLTCNAHSWSNCEISTKWTRQPWLSPFKLWADVLSKTIIPLALVGYEMIIASASLAIYHLTCNAHSRNNCQISTKSTRQPWLSPFKLWSQSRITLSFRIRCMAWYGWRKFPAKCRTVMFWWCWRLPCVMTWTILATIMPTR